MATFSVCSNGKREEASRTLKRVFPAALIELGQGIITLSSDELDGSARHEIAEALGIEPQMIYWMS
jgi:hypothetical protein